MFAVRFFARRFFAPRYFPPGGVLVVPRRKGHYPTLVRLIEEEKREPAIAAQSLMSSLIQRYGPVEGARVYFKMERERKGPFQEGAKYGDERLGAGNPVAKLSSEQMIAEAIRVRMGKKPKRR